MYEPLYLRKTNTGHIINTNIKPALAAINGSIGTTGQDIITWTNYLQTKTIRQKLQILYAL